MALMDSDANVKLTYTPILGTNASYVRARDATITGDLTIHDKITIINKYTFYNCTSLKSIIIPDSVIIIDEEAFQNCNSLKRVIFSANSKLTNIRDNAFYDCTSLTSINFPRNAIIGSNVFYNCPLIYITSTATNKYVISGTRIVFSIINKSTTQYSYQWQQNGLDIPNETNVTYEFYPSYNVTGDNNVKIECILTDLNIDELIKPAAIDVIVYDIPKLSIYMHSSNYDVIDKDSVNIYSTISSKQMITSYDWIKDNDFFNNSSVNYISIDECLFNCIYSYNGLNTNIYKLRITDINNNIFESNSITLNVYKPLEGNIVSSTPTNTIEDGTTITLTSSALYGKAPYTFIWYFNNSIISSDKIILTENSSKYVFTAGAANSYKQYACVIRDSMALPTTINVNTLFLIYKNITNTIVVFPNNNVNEETQVVITINVVNGVFPYSYNWFVNDTPISNAIRNSYSFKAISSLNKNKYKCIATDFIGNKTESNEVVIRARTPPPDKFLSVLPYNIVTSGETMVFSAIFQTNNVTYSYAWLLDGTQIENENSNTYTLIANYNNHNNKTITVKITDISTNESYFDSITLTIYKQIEAIIRVSPSNIITSMSVINFTADAKFGCGDYTYIWYKKKQDVEEIVARNVKNYSFLTTIEDNNYIYSCVIYDNKLNVTTSTKSNEIEIIVNPLPSCELYLDSDPSLLTKIANVGTNVTFNAKVEGGTGNFTYRWIKVIPISSPISGAIASTYKINSINKNNEGMYYVIAVDSTGAECISNLVNILVTIPLNVVTQPLSKKILLTNTASPMELSVETTGSIAPLSYKWYKRIGGIETLVQEDLNANESFSNTFSISSVKISDEGSYYVKIQVSDDTFILSDVAFVEVNTIPIITKDIQNVTTTLGETFDISVSAIGTKQLIYTFYKKSTNNSDPDIVIQSSYFNILNFKNIKLEDGGKYYATVQNNNGDFVKSSVIDITVYNVDSYFS